MTERRDHWTTRDGRGYDINDGLHPGRLAMDFVSRGFDGAGADSSGFHDGAGDLCWESKRVAAVEGFSVAAFEPWPVEASCGCRLNANDSRKPREAVEGDSG